MGYKKRTDAVNTNIKILLTIYLKVNLYLVDLIDFYYVMILNFIVRHG